MSESHQYSLRLLIITCILCLYVFMPQVTNMILAWGNVTRMVENIASANYSMLALCKLVCTWYHGKTLRMLMTSVVTDWMISKNDEDRSTMLNIARHGRTLSFRCYITSSGALLFYLYINIMKIYRNIHQPHWILVYHFAYFYNIRKSPNYEITYVIQLLGGIYTAFINSTVDSFISILLLHICAQLINLRSALNNLVDELAKKSISSAEFKKRLATITVRHEHLISNAKTIDDCYSTVLFINMFAVTFQLCFQAFQIFTMITSNLNISVMRVSFLSFYVLLVISHLYIYCYSAERLLIESTSMAYGMYECKWYDISPKDAKNLMFMAYRSTIPLKLTAGKFGTFSLEMFATVRYKKKLLYLLYIFKLIK
ncbi:hypothetical protein PUN28_008930 [Cardiocondyla obscurior]|uniref:Odorant receptor n=1 Tax=Cardiocondyla obscurior TaxID=286306 RepID=A0AAW2FQ40_9HYME